MTDNGGISTDPTGESGPADYVLADTVATNIPASTTRAHPVCGSTPAAYSAR